MAVVFDAPLEILTGLESRQTEGCRADSTGVERKGESRTNVRRKVSEITVNERIVSSIFFISEEKEVNSDLYREFSRLQIKSRIKRKNIIFFV